MPSWGSLYFQNGVSPLMEQMIFFHDHSMMVMVLVMVMVGYLLLISLFESNYNRMMFEGQELEMIWTLVPVVFLLVIAFPSLRLLYLMEEMEDPEVSVKSLGHQWFWSYEYADLSVKNFDSYMMENGLFRLLEVDNALVLPFETNIRMVISASDVIHSWTIPSLGVKADGIPGRLNQISMFINRPGIFFGQCSEICGANHSFMPIMMMTISKNGFLAFLK